MKVEKFNIFPVKQTSDSLSVKVTFLDSNGNNIDFFVVFNTRKISDNFRDDIHGIVNQRIVELIESSEAFTDKYEIVITDRDFF